MYEANVIKLQCDAVQFNAMRKYFNATQCMPICVYQKADHQGCHAVVPAHTYNVCAAVHDVKS